MYEVRTVGSGERDTACRKNKIVENGFSCPVSLDSIVNIVYNMRNQGADMPTETGLGTSYDIHLTFSCGRWEVGTVLNEVVYSAFGATADVALDNLSKEIRLNREKTNNECTSR